MLSPLYSRIVWVSGYLSRISVWFSPTRNLKIQCNPGMGTTEWTVHSEISVETQPAWGCPRVRQLSTALLEALPQLPVSREHQRMSLPYQALSFFCILPFPVVDWVACIRWLKPKMREVIYSWTDGTEKTKPFTSHIISFYVNLLPILFLLSLNGSSSNV